MNHLMAEHVIDFHMHPYLCPEENACMYREDFYLTPEEARRDLEHAGISHICGSVIAPGAYRAQDGWQHIERLNQSALKAKELYGSFYTPGFHIHPAFVKESMDTIEWMHQNGHRLVGELVPYMHGWKDCGLDYGSPALQEILALAGEYDMIVSYHTILDQQEQMERMIASNPKVHFVAAHPGQRGDYMRQLDRIIRYDNVSLDLSGTGLFRYGMLVEGIKKVGAGRLIFGTDYPISNPGMYVQAVLYEHISDADREKIFRKNAIELFGWNENDI